ncbi:hypothetical protein COCCU_10830 [Corynebacterium occultum]|uniref:Uncharacterized protein n=1 Tax=Corynebacterium occultum TaxID=2675219 RepID=A0A6B8VVB6_9CORY|nr:hypothetical protein [Corynebacterium occultum]QGU08083.1 hypothetical protein COCCU_10830 [Corynebacterium occultum]
MLSTTIIASVIAFLGGVAAYYTWKENRGLSIICGALGTLAAAIAVVLAFIGTLMLIMKIIPILLLVGMVWLCWYLFTRRNSRAEKVDIT